MKIKYTRTKVFHYPERLSVLPAEEQGIVSPIHIRIKPTNRCNHSCSYCAYSDKSLDRFGKDTGRGADFIPRDKMLEIVDDLIAMDIRAVTFSGGGEPFMYPFLKETVEKLAGSTIRFASLTNGALLEGEIAELFARFATWVRVSIDGWDEESYSAYRKVARGEFARVISNMEKFKNIGGQCALGVSLIVDERNSPHVYDMLSRFKNIGLDSVKISPCLVGNKPGESNAYHDRIRIRVQEQVQRAVCDLKCEEFQIFDAYTELDTKFEKDYQWCPCLQLLPVIGADGNVYSCPDKAYDIKKGLLGSIVKQRFRDLWFSSKARFFRINPSVDCMHHCERNPLNRLILEYLFADDRHLGFV